MHEPRREPMEDRTKIQTAVPPRLDEVHGLTLKAHAEIAAELAEGTTAPSDVLAKHELDEAKWNEATTQWMKYLAADVQARGAEARAPLVYSEAFAEAQGQLAEPPEVTAEEYATLVAEIMAAGDPSGPLAQRGWSNADYIRLSRSMATKLAHDGDAHERYSQRLFHLQTEAGAQS